MPVRFLIGRSGAGKTQWCLRAIVDEVRQSPLGKPIFWITPRQATYSAERQLVTESGLPAVCRVRVLSFDDLANLVLADCGGAAIPVITLAGRRLILAHLLRKLQPKLTFFAGVAHQPGLADTLGATFAEFEKSGHSPAQIIDALDSQMDDLSDLLRPKLADLRLLYEAYSNFLGQDRLDPHRRNEQVVSCMKDAKGLQGASVYIDGFYDYTESERQMICGLAGTCRQVWVTLLADPDCPLIAKPDLMPSETGLFHRTEDGYRRLVMSLRKVGVMIGPSERLREAMRFESPDLARIERETFSTHPSTGAGKTNETERDKATISDAVSFVEANDRRAEVDAAARHILSLLRRGHRMRDIAVLVRHLDDYQELVDASFREHGIAFFVDRRRNAAHHPLLQLVRSVLEIARDGWTSSAAFSLIKTGLAGLSLAEADELENYALDHRIRPADWTASSPWIYRRTLIHESEGDQAVIEAATRAQRADAMRRRVVDAVGPLVTASEKPNARRLREFAADLYALLNRLNVSGTLRDWIALAGAAQEFEQAAEHRRVWVEFIELLDQLVELLGEEQTTTDEFAELLNTSLNALDLALVPPTLDQVLVGQVDRTRLPEVRATLVLGLGDGEFPRTPREDSVLNDRDRQRIGSHDVQLAGDGQRRLRDESLLGYIAFTSPTQRLYLSRVACDPAGKPAAPSPYWVKLRSLFPDVPVTNVGSSDDDDPAQIATPRQLVVATMHWARGQTAPEQDASFAGLYHWLADQKTAGSAVAQARYQAWGALSYRNTATLKPETARRLFIEPLKVSVRQLETFAACPFKHFVEYGLSLHRRRDDSFTAIDLSHVYHDVLERFVRQMIHANHEWRDLTEDWTDVRIAAAARQIGTELQTDLAIEPGRSQYLQDRIERTVRRIVHRQRVMSGRSGLASGYAGVSFGTENATLGPLEIATPKGRKLHIRGRIDRIDLLADSPHAAVFDYKLSAGRLSAGEIYNGLALQLLTYLLVLQSNGHQLAGSPITPAAGFYLQLLRGLEAVDHPDDALDTASDEFHLKPKPRGIFDAAHLAALDNQLTQGASDMWHVQIKKEGGFGFRESSDVCDADEFLRVLDFVRGKLAGLADGILSGSIRIYPYRLHRKSPCAQCEFKSVCRFDVTLNGYNMLTEISRDELLKTVR